jgi:DNA-directed RNA polymerase specialized sigma24 family protein
MPNASPADILELLARLRAPLRRLFQERGISPEEAEEILQEAMLLFLKRSPAADDPAALLLCLVEDRIRHRQKRLRRDRRLLRQAR